MRRYSAFLRIVTALCIGAFLCAGLCGCDKQNAAAQAAVPGAVAADEPGQEEPLQWHPEDGYICIVFGYGFNNPEFHEDAIKKLQEKYGLEEDGGIIIPLIYPDSLNGRISNIYDIITEHKTKGVILLGAPENTHRTLTKLRAAWQEPSAAEADGTEESQPDGQQPYPIFSFMPQDDILGQESNCDFVLEYERSSSIEEELNQETELLDKTVEQILIRAVRYIDEHKDPLPPDDKLHAHVQTIVGDHKIHRYTDSESGLQAINHFVIEQTQEPLE